MRRSQGAFMLAAAAALGLARSEPAAAQLRASALSVGGRLLAASPVGDRGERLEAGTGFGVDAGYQLRPRLTLYAGFSRVVFPVRGAAEATDRVDSGAEVGVLLARVAGGVPLRLRGGLTLHEAETHLASAGGDGLDDGRSAVGLEGGAGVEIRLGRRLVLLPGVACTVHPPGDSGGVTHLRAELGARLRP